MGAHCQVCSAPVAQKDGVCVFCHSPVSGEGDPRELLDYLAAHLPGVRARHTLLGRGKVSGISMAGQATTYRARWRRGRMSLEPDVRLEEWLEMLLHDVSRMASASPEVRRTVSRSGWAFR